MISTVELAQKEFTGIKLPDPYGTMLGDISESASMSIWGPPGSGKSTFALDLACILADEVGKGIYCSSEEGMGPSLQNRVKRLKAQHDNLLVSDFESIDELKSDINSAKAEFVILDSISKSNIRLKDFEEFLDWCQQKRVISVFILHTTKTGTYKGPTEYIHDPDIEIQVEEGVARTGKNRFQETPREMEILFNKNGSVKNGSGKSNSSEKRSNPEMVWRYKSQYDTSRKAWTSIAGATDLEPKDVRPDHSKKKWRWKVKTRDNTAGSVATKGVDQSLLHGIEYIENPEEELRENRAVKPKEIYDMITDNIINVIKNEGELPWQKRYDSQYFNQAATNFASKNQYRGINFIMLNYFRWIKEDGKKVLVPHRWKNPYFMTFNQIDEMGGKVKDGAVSQRAMFFTLLYSFEQDSPELEFSTFDRDEIIEWFQDNRSDIELLKTFTPAQLADQSYYPILKYYNLFNGEDIEGITFGEALDTSRLSDADRIKTAEAIWEHYPDKPKLVHEEQQPKYIFVNDTINMPKFGSYEEPQYYYSTLFHEAIHSTGHESRLKRDFGRKFGDDKYAFEELVAEMGAAYLSGEAGILFRTLNQSAAYLKGWNKRLVKAMEDNSEFFFRAASRSQEAADFILARNNDGIPAYLKNLDLELSGSKMPQAKDREGKKKVKGKVSRSGKIDVITGVAPTDSPKRVKEIANQEDIIFLGSIEQLKELVLANPELNKEFPDASEQDLMEHLEAMFDVRFHTRAGLINAMDLVTDYNSKKVIIPIESDIAIKLIRYKKQHPDPDLDPRKAFSAYRDGFYTNGMVLIDDEQIAHELLDDMYDDIKKQAMKSGGLKAKRDKQKEIDRKIKETQSLVISKAIPSKKDLRYARLLGITNSDAGPLLVAYYSDGEAAFNIDLFYFVAKYLPDSTFKLNKSGAQGSAFVKDDVIKGLVMPYSITTDILKPPINPSPYDSVRGNPGLFLEEPATINLGVRANPTGPLIYMGTTERITIDGGENQFEMKGEFPSFVSEDKLYIMPFDRVRKVAQAVDEQGAIEAFEDWHNYQADEIDYEIDWPEKVAVKPVGTAKKIWYASDKIISEGDQKGKMNHYVHEFDKGKRPAVVKGDILIVGNINWDERGLLN